MSLSEDFLTFRNELVKELPKPNMLLCCTADRLLILLEEQEREFAALKSREFFPQGFPPTWLAAVERMKEQHSADLRAVAEMAIKAGMRWTGLVKYPTTDSIVREFREKKAKVGK